MEIKIDHPRLYSWLKDQRIIAKNFNNREGNLLVVSEDSKNCRFQLTRAFRVGENVMVSVDMTTDNLEDVLMYLVENR